MRTFTVVAILPGFAALLGFLNERWLRLQLSIGLMLLALLTTRGAGGTLVQVIQAPGLKLVLAGAIVTTFCTFATFVFGRFEQRLNEARNAGATCAAKTGVAIDEVVKDAKSGVPAIDYALPGAVNYIVFTIVGLFRMENV